MQPINRLAHFGYIYDCVIAQHPDLIMETGHDAILWVIPVGIAQHTDLLMEIEHDAILCHRCAIG